MEFPIISTQYKHAQKLMNLNIITFVQRQSATAVSGVPSRILREHYTITEHVGCSVCIISVQLLFQETLEIFQTHPLSHAHSSTVSLGVGTGLKVDEESFSDWFTCTCTCTLLLGVSSDLSWLTTSNRVTNTDPNSKCKIHTCSSMHTKPSVFWTHTQM